MNTTGPCPFVPIVPCVPFASFVPFVAFVAFCRSDGLSTTAYQRDYGEGRRGPRRCVAHTVQAGACGRQVPWLRRGEGMWYPLSLPGVSSTCTLLGVPVFAVVLPVLISSVCPCPLLFPLFPCLLSAFNLLCIPGAAHFTGAAARKQSRPRSGTASFAITQHACSMVSCIFHAVRAARV